MDNNSRIMKELKELKEAAKNVRKLLIIANRKLKDWLRSLARLLSIVWSVWRQKWAALEVDFDLNSIHCDGLSELWRMLWLPLLE